MCDAAVPNNVGIRYRDGGYGAITLGWFWERFITDVVNRSDGSCLACLCSHMIHFYVES